MTKGTGPQAGSQVRAAAQRWMRSQVEQRNDNRTFGVSPVHRAESP
jgi:hypothetical protein